MGSTRPAQRADLCDWGDWLREWLRGSDDPRADAAIANVLEVVVMHRQSLIKSNG